MFIFSFYLSLIFLLFFAGHYDLEYRIVICTRENNVFVLRKNNKGDCHINSFYIREHPFNVIFCSSQVKKIF